VAWVVSVPCPRNRAFAGGAELVTARSAGNPAGVDELGTAGDLAVERAGRPGTQHEVGSSNTRPTDRSVTPRPAWNDARELRRDRRGYVFNRWTGEVLSSVIADVRRERGQ
jgi:hypothetical protein